jgi:competence ComEA-like helix-hairpin-helix protein
LFLLPAVYDFNRPQEAQTDHTAFLEAVAELEAMQQAPDAPPRVAAAFYFDPNTADEEVLHALGIPAAAARTIINYRNKIGPFHTAEDLKKIYNLSDEDYARLKDHIRIQPETTAKRKKKVKKAPPSPKVFDFDPNTADRAALLQLGLPPKTAATLIKYRQKGGKFYRKEDLKKIYGLPEKDYQRLEPYISIAAADEPGPEGTASISFNASEERKAIPVSYSSPAPIKIDINQSTATDWQKLYGIGPVLSKRIVKFRDKLGGFSAVEQVAETFGLPDSTFQAIRPQLKFSPISKKIAINTASAEALQAHPYIQWSQANVMVAYRKEHGPYRRLEDLKKVIALNEDLIDRLAPYLSFE